MDLPEGFVARPHVPSDAQAVTDLVAAAEEVDAGESAIELEDILGDWQRPSFDLATQSIGVFDGDRLAATGDVFKGRRCEAAVHPDYRRRGIGTWLAGWLEDTARAGGSTLVGQSVPSGSSAEVFLRARGYREGWTSWVLQLPEAARIQAQPLPDGYTLREFAAGDERAAFQLIEDAFNEWPHRDPAVFEDWASRTVLRPGFEPWQIRFALARDSEPVGVCFTILAGRTGYVDQLAVRADQRGRGLARALLVDAFERARQRGASTSELATDSRTGALGLYEHVGMQVTQTWRHWMTDLG
ncbi:GNAT family N-acetyltransferase [Knoellia sp. 3-2P3]|uniref:GNAT family N-acetyltransferase n=1 Tax=unclassified Knoellia TaxID=2618719 RepID=UPI0023DC4595|nr:GNAT family N-acetyltransferase [Knoellia sp. 3-2P3]MDF2092743.1 GNAT family N-acetyltransferase [Knoellia sp. 3-2P3]